MALQCPLQALEEQRQNHARVAPGAPQCGGSGGLGHGVQLGAVHTPQIVGCGVDSHGHIRAGVAIGYGENVQFIQILLLWISIEAAALRIIRFSSAPEMVCNC